MKDAWKEGVLGIPHIDSSCLEDSCHTWTRGMSISIFLNSSWCLEVSWGSSSFRSSESSFHFYENQFDNWDTATEICVTLAFGEIVSKVVQSRTVSLVVAWVERNSRVVKSYQKCRMTLNVYKIWKDVMTGFILCFQQMKQLWRLCRLWFQH
jgi:hypothetical protein